MTAGRHRLVLIEGMVGAGKSTTAAHVARWLVEQGEDARAYDEFADDHPIRTRAVDLLRAASDEVATPPDVGEDGLARDRSVYAIEHWGVLARRCRHERRTVIVESTFLQNSVLPRFIYGAPIDEVRAVFAGIEAQMAPADPLLVYLRPSDTARAVARVHCERGEPWSSRNLVAVTNSPWARARGVSGEEAVVAFYREWEGVVDLLLDGATSAKLVLVDPQDDWDAALRRIQAALRLGGKEQR